MTGMKVGGADTAHGGEPWLVSSPTSDIHPIKYALIKSCFLFFSFLFIGGNFVTAQLYNIVIKGGHVIDPKNNINRVMDIAINDGKIALVAASINAKDARQVVEIPALKSGFYPNSISIDLHTGSMNASMKNMLNIMSIFLAMGMDLPDVIKASTWNPAVEIKHEELGNLSVGSIADVAVLNLREGKFGFWDRNGYKLKSKQRLECEMTIRAGNIVYDLNGITDPEVIKSGE